jgi:hypothetical protein
VLLDDAIAITLYSLTKYSAIFTEMKGYFGIIISNNHLEDGTHVPSEFVAGDNLAINWV